MSRRHERRHNWQGVVLSQRVEQQQKRQRAEQLFRDQGDAVRRWLRDVFAQGIAQARVEQGVDRWEDDGGSFF